MDAPIGTSKATCHLRSISLPSRPHPQEVSIEEQLSRLRSSQAASSSICNKLSGLKVLYGCVDELIQFPLSQQSLSNEQNRKWAEEVLDGSLHLLEVSGTARDGFVTMKECLQDLESSLRRKRGGECTLENEVEAYMVSRRKVKKEIQKRIRNVRNVRKDSNMATTVGLLKEVQETGLAVFESLLSFLGKPRSRARSNGWSIVLNLLPSKNRSSQEEVTTNEVEMLDADLIALKSKKEFDFVQVQKVLKGLEALESTIQEAVEELECTYRQLVKIRVSILNFLNH